MLFNGSDYVDDNPGFFRCVADLAVHKFIVETLGSSQSANCFGNCYPSEVRQLQNGWPAAGSVDTILS